MPWGSRRSNDDGFHCSSCSDWTSFDESADCSCCGEVYCSDCVQIECTGCKEKDSLCGYHICESCIPYPGCRACDDEDITFCTECLTDHLKNCNKSSRAQRIINSETYSIEQDEETITQLRASIASQQARLSSLEHRVAASKVRKANAEAELKNGEEGSSAKKQKTEE